jgi:pimeloyl-ACP methyl ester carboxylesterase
MLQAIRLFFFFAGRLSPSLAGRLAALLFARPRRHERPSRERELIARGQSVALPDGLRATSWGAGPAVLLVHGWEGRGAQLGALVDPLVAAGYRVVALDGPAHGDSEGRSTTGPEFAAATTVVRDAIGPLAALVAHSFGGFTSMLAISRGLTVDRLVVIAAPSSVPDILQDFMKMIALPAAAFPALVRALERRVGASMASFAVESFASAVTVPLLIVHDIDDREVPYANATRLRELFPAARLLTTTGLGHRRILFAPEVVASVVEFIEEGRVMRASVRSAREEA